MEKQFYTLQELAELLEVNQMTIRRLVNRNALPYYKVGRVFRFKVDEIEAWLGTQRGGPKPYKGKDHEDHDQGGA